MAKYFKESEVAGLDQRLIDMLDRLRERANIPIKITCGRRTPEENSALKTSVSDSAHLQGLAVDISCQDSQTRYALVEAAFFVGFRRIGIETLHLHLDIDATKPQNVAFLGISS